MVVDMENAAGARRRTGERGARLRGRSERVVRAVLDAALAELGRVGYAKLRVEDVSALASVNKTTVYRRWPTKVDLVAAALNAHSDTFDAAPDTGSLRGDLVTMLVSFAARASAPEARAIMQMITLERIDPEVATITRALRERHTTRRLPVIERAIARGELDPDIDARLLLEVVLAPVLGRLKWSGDPVDLPFIEGVVDIVLAGARRPTLPRRAATPPGR
jgi:AcrR family transcriptional regulator